MLLQASSFKLQLPWLSGFFQANDPAVLQAVGSPFQASANPERTGSRQFPDSPCQSSHPLHPFFPGPKARKSVIYLYNLLGIILKLFLTSQWIFGGESTQAQIRRPAFCRKQVSYERQSICASIPRPMSSPASPCSSAESAQSTWTFVPRQPLARLRRMAQRFRRRMSELIRYRSYFQASLR